ncbi:helix-turn-helix domain-containing protein [Bradyrhizobium uaiense]|uniref:Helix-turn-helix domain-containing protein n=1 Tax=Bradyrhizobium uaiense TaxID=2594946 RepID=A0A6P1BDL1_9BRAD|nr:helix-turn-helix domain-containing protein [Bradyrhizobium uaiense]NEU95671.1 helix-turn-helix domain-containing protein [Bradyrhizobium uaiense]
MHAPLFIKRRVGRFLSNATKGSQVTIAQHTFTSNYTVIGNACFNDERLSFEALAIFTYLRSKPSDWMVRQTELARRFKAGRDRVRNAINELIAAGYIRKVQERIAGRWGAAGYDVLAAPDAPAPEEPSPENRSLLNTDLLPSTDSTKKDNSRIATDVANASEVDRSPNAAPSTSTCRPLPPSRSLAMYQQSTVEARLAFDELQKLDGWCGTWEDDPLVHWHALLRRGYAADDIVDTAADYLRGTHDAPSLGDWLSSFESYLQDDTDGAAIPAHRGGLHMMRQRLGARSPAFRNPAASGHL